MSLANLNQDSNTCRICGTYARYIYFGVLSCQACKIFFRRHANTREIALKCLYNSQCEINTNNRHICKSCRLVKCFQCGMTTDKFCSFQHTKRKIKTSKKEQISHHIEIFPTLNLLQSDISLFTSDQWTLLSNLNNIYQESQLLSICQHLVDTHKFCRSNDISFPRLVENFLISLYETTGIYLYKNGDFHDLSFDDRSLLLHSAADKVTCLSSTFIMNQYDLLLLDMFQHIMKMKYGNCTIDMQLSASKFIDTDIVLIKLGISLFAISETTYILNCDNTKIFINHMKIIHIQNRYAEITWKYLLYTYDYEQAVKRFLKLICWLLATTNLHIHAQNLTLHVQDVNQLVEKTELALILNDIEQIIE
ncbi:hypothetical protein I4U23_000894 [Adineta vaga]|nr:hypothetical protein I4U23_000894 [Adineta vaga]